jgi:O-antigen ligase
MIKLTTAALCFLAAGLFTSVTLLSAHQILFAIPLFYFTYQAITSKEKFELPTSAWFLLAFTAVALISLIVNYELIPKPSKNFGRLKYPLFGALGIFVFRVWLKEASDKIKKNLVHLFLVSMIVAGLYAAWEFFISGQERVKSLTETMRYGYGSAMALLVVLSALLHKDKTKKWMDYRLGIAAFVIGFMGMYLTYTRGALLGFLCGLPFVLYYYRPKLGLTLGGLAVLGVLGLGSIYLFGSGNYESRFLVNKDNSSDVVRRSQWKAAIIATQEKPVLGYGFSNFPSQLKRIKHQYDLDAKGYDTQHSHNVFLETMAGTGLIGLGLFLAWLISWAIEAFKAKGLTRALIIPFGAAFVTSGQFEVTLDANNASMLFFIYTISSVRLKNV